LHLVAGLLDGLGGLGVSSRLLGDRYRLDEQLGRGGTATVWRGRDMHLDRPIAVKVLRRTEPAQREALRRLQREARTVAQLDHPNIVGVYDFGLDGDTAYLVMALVPGRNLAEVLAVEGPLPVDRAVAIATQVCGALETAHQAAVVHRDIKPGNIIVGRDGAVKVCDFGIARWSTRAGGHSPDDGNTIDGTCEFMAPEQVTGGAIGPRSDLYGLGCVLYAMLTGRPPFVADDSLAVLDRHVNERPRPLRSWRIDLPPELERLVDELLAKDPAAWPADATVVRDRLARLVSAPAATGLGADPVGDRPTRSLPLAEPTRVTDVPPADEPTGRHRRPSPLPAWLGEWWVAAASVAAIAVTLVTVGVVVTSGDGDPPVRAQDRGGSRPSATAPGAPGADGLTPTPEPTVTVTVTDEPTTPPGTTPPAGPPAEPPTSFAAAIQQQVRSGQLDPRAGQELLQRLEKITRRPRAGRNDKVAQGLAEVGRRLDELRRDGQLSDAGFTALIAFTARV
jgi:serine/threonine-protein kinase